jgi:hypothetical protein
MVMSKQKNDGITVLKEEKKPKWKPDAETKRAVDVLNEVTDGGVTASQECVHLSHETAIGLANYLLDVSKIKDRADKAMSAFTVIDDLLVMADETIVTVREPKKSKKSS